MKRYVYISSTVTVGLGILPQRFLGFTKPMYQTTKKKMVESPRTDNILALLIVKCWRFKGSYSTRER